MRRSECACVSLPLAVALVLFILASALRVARGLPGRLIWRTRILLLANSRRWPGPAAGVLPRRLDPRLGMRPIRRLCRTLPGIDGLLARHWLSSRGYLNSLRLVALLDDRLTRFVAVVAALEGLLLLRRRIPIA